MAKKPEPPAPDVSTKKVVEAKTPLTAAPPAPLKQAPPIQAQSRQAQPSQTQPSQIQPSQIQPSQAPLKPIQPSSAQPSQLQPSQAQTKGTQITTPPSEEAVRIGAYLRWDAAGRPAGDGVRFWMEAEQELRSGNVAPVGKSKGSGFINDRVTYEEARDFIYDHMNN